ncbi:MAG TPA: hypothetical protein VFX15_13345 [Actinomycetes bacterium]|nr:hypothetical protein [Actinomycetes bacterium]
MATPAKTLTIAAITLAGAGLLAACGSSSGDSGDSGSGGPSLTITSPTPGSKVGTSVDVAWDSSVELGEPDTGRDHVHVFVDGESNDYTVVGGNEFTVTGLTPGAHTIDVTLQHADHSSAGASDEVDVTVTKSGGTGSTPSPSPSESDTSSGRYDY